jgi:predicted chitinase
VIAALEYWKNNNLNKYADLDLDAISDIINGTSY